MNNRFKNLFFWLSGAGTDTLELLVTAQRQHAQSKLWVDDLSIIRLPVPPLKTGAAAGPGTSTSAPPEE